MATELWHRSDGVPRSKVHLHLRPGAPGLSILQINFRFPLDKPLNIGAPDELHCGINVTLMRPPIKEVVSTIHNVAP